MAGFFGFFDYTKEGKGVSKNEKKKKGLELFFTVLYRKFWKLVQVNLLYIIFCIPIITIGPATCAMTYILRNYAREEHAFILSDFLEHFKKNFKQGLIFGIIDFVIYYLIFFAFNFYSKTDYLLFLKYFMIVVFAIYTIMRFYIYPMIITFHLSLKQIFNNALIFSLAKFPYNLLIVLYCVIISFMFFYYYRLGIILTPFLLFSVLGLLINVFINPIIKEYMIDKQSENNQNEQL